MATTIELKTKFTKLLKEMFQLDQPELDFGLYKIMHSKAERINRFLDVELANQIDAVFADADQANQSQAIETAKQTLVGQLGEGAFDENGQLVEHFKTVPAAKDYLSAVTQAKSGKGNLSERAMIYDHLIRFFSRYYDGGDFMSRRYHVAENKSRASAYAVPYDGSEVYLHWANKDQYYIKTTESFNQYSFDIAEAAKKQAEQAQKQNKSGTLDLEAAPQLATKRIHFKLVDAAQGEHNNNKESEKRQFFIREDQPLALNEAGELEVYFEFRVASKNDAISAEQEKQLKSRFSASNKGDLPNLHITQVIQDALLNMQEQPGLVDFVKFAQILAPTDKIKQRPLLTKYLNNYTSKNTMDYFIHKDLGGFLQRELDFYIKNEIMRLDDIEQAEEKSYVRLLQQIKTLRGVAKEIIHFLAQLEDFQKKLWLKKKFVTETQYCITMDRLAEQPGLVKIALDNEKQRQEWLKLFAIDLSELDQLKAQGIDAVLENERYRYLVLDTQFFDTGFKDELLAEIEDLDEQSNGLLINSDNFQALNLSEELYKEKASNIFIDPPYNTGDDGFVYKDSYQSSSWLTMISDRVERGFDLLKPDGAFFISIGDEEYENLASLIRASYGKKRFFSTLIWEKKKKGSFLSGNVAKMKDYIICISKDQQKFNGLIGEVASDVTTYPCVNASNGREIRTIPPGIASKFREENFFLGKGSIISAGNMNLVLHSDLQITNSVLAKELVIEGNWRYSQANMLSYANNNEIYITQDLYLRRIVSEPRFKRMKDILSRVGDQEGNFREYDLSNLSRYGWGTNEDANDELHQILGEQYAVSYPKPSKLLTLLLKATRHETGLWIDYFAGSGTTGHAVINLNREDQGNRKYILCEMGAYFDSVTKPRIQKVLYANDWKDGKPVFDKDGKAGGVSQCFKYLRLEQYEDTLNNLIDSRTYNPESVPKDFVLSYLLEAETAESPSLLNLQQFSQPRNYQLQIKRPNSDQSTLQTIDLVETFNWLIGLNVVKLDKLDKWRAYDCEFVREHDPELPNDQHTRLKVKGKLKQVDAYSENAPAYQIRTVEGWVRRQPGNDELRDSVLVIWRNLSDDPEQDSAVLEALLDKFKINQADTQFDKIYINGPHGLQLHGSAKTRLLSLEDIFMTKMWEGA